MAPVPLLVWAWGVEVDDGSDTFNQERLEAYFASDGFKNNDAIGTFRLTPLGGRLRLLVKQQGRNYFLYDEHVDGAFDTGKQVSSTELFRLAALGILYRLDVERYWHTPMFSFSLMMWLVGVPLIVYTAIISYAIRALFGGYLDLPYNLDEFLTDDTVVSQILLLVSVLAPVLLFIFLSFMISNLIFRFLFDSRDKPYADRFRGLEAQLVSSSEERRPLKLAAPDDLPSYQVRNVYSLHNTRGIDSLVNVHPSETPNDPQWNTYRTTWRKQFTTRYRRVGGLLAPPVRMAFLPIGDNKFERRGFAQSLADRVYIPVAFLVFAIVLAFQFPASVPTVLTVPAVVSLIVSLVIIGLTTWGNISICLLRRHVNKWRKAKRERFRTFLRVEAEAIADARKVVDVRRAWGLEDYVRRTANY